MVLYISHDMKFRPQVQLRFRDEGQYEGCKGRAAGEGVSLNEWVLRQIEGDYVGVRKKVVEVEVGGVVVKEKKGKGEKGEKGEKGGLRAGHHVRCGCVVCVGARG